VAIRITDPDTDMDLYHDTGKTCLGRGMHCPSAFSFWLVSVTVPCSSWSCVPDRFWAYIITSLSYRYISL